MRKKWTCLSLLFIAVSLSRLTGSVSVENSGDEFIQTNSSADENNYRAYYTNDSICQMGIRMKDDSILGSHCFVNYNGSRIDCCVEDTLSLLLKRTSNGIYEGVMHSCYRDDMVPVMMNFTPDRKLIFIILNHDDYFYDIEDTTIFQ